MWVILSPHGEGIGSETASQDGDAYPYLATTRLGIHYVAPCALLAGANTPEPTLVGHTQA
jgi:hypothetical protein